MVADVSKETGVFEMSVTIYQSTQRNMKKDINLQWRSFDTREWYKNVTWSTSV